jgi:CheY-like chemotaxis protein
MLIDVGLPGMDGYELVRRLRADAGLASIRLIAVTGYGQESDRRRALEAGFDEHLVKPVDLNRLQSMLWTAQR